MSDLKLTPEELLAAYENPADDLDTGLRQVQAAILSKLCGMKLEEAREPLSQMEDSECKDCDAETHNRCLSGDYHLLCWQTINHIFNVLSPIVAAKIEAAKVDNLLLRQLLFASHPCKQKYSDDGELQCNRDAPIDFLRDSAEEIERKSELHGLDRLREQMEVKHE